MLLQADDHELADFVEGLFEGEEVTTDIAPSYTQLGRVSRKQIEGAIRDLLAQCYSALRTGGNAAAGFLGDTKDFISDFVNENLSALHSILCGPSTPDNSDDIGSKGSVSNSIAIAQMAILIQLAADTFSATFAECFVIAVLTIFFVKNTFGKSFCE